MNTNVGALETASPLLCSSSTSYDWIIDINLKAERTVWILFEELSELHVQDILNSIHENSILIQASISQRDSQTKASPLSSNHEYIYESSIPSLIKKINSKINRDIYDTWKPLITNDFARNNIKYVKEIFGAISEVFNSEVLGKATTEQVSLIFVKFAIFNLLHSIDHTTPQCLRKSLSGRPAVIVSAGPSLTKQLDFLAEYKDVLTILCVDSIWNILHERGIEPDIVFGLDAYNRPSWTRESLSKNTILVTDIGCHPKMYQSSGQPQLVTAHMPQLGALAESLGQPTLFLPSGGNVSTSLFNLARYLDANPIILIGQDLAYTDGEDHAEGYQYTYSESLKKERFETGFDVDGYYGGKLRTERQFLHYKAWFEEQIASLDSQYMVINSTEGGASIKGAFQLPFLSVCKELMSVFKDKPDLTSIIEGKPGLSVTERLQLLQELRLRISNYKKVADRGLSHTKGFSHRKAEGFFKKIDKLNAELISIDATVKYVIDKFIVKRLDNIRRDFARKDAESPERQRLRQSVEGYRDIYEQVQMACELALKGIDELISTVERGGENSAIDIGDFPPTWKNFLVEQSPILSTIF